MKRLPVKIMHSTLLALCAAAACVAYLCSSALAADNADLQNRVQRLQSQKPGDRAVAVQEIGKSGAGREAAKALSDRLASEKDPQVRTGIANTLGTVQSRESAGVLLRLAKEDASADVRSSSCLSLGALGDKTALPVLKEIALNEREDDNVRISAASALASYIREPGVADTLSKLLKGSNTVVKFGTVNALRTCRSTAEGKALLAITADDSNEDTRALSRELLK
jgi:HEAT repeat protein